MAGFANDVVYANNGDFSIAGSNKGSLANGLVTDGKIWIGSTSTNAGGTHINVGQVVTANSTVQFGYNTPNISLDFNKQNIAFGTSMPALTSGISNLVIGVFGSGSAITSGNENILLGSFNGSKLTTGSDNVFIGVSSGNSTTLSSRNVAIGSATLVNYGTGGATDGNIAIGYGSLGNLASGTRNLVIGYFVGNNYTTTESSNILIGNAGVIGDNNIIKIGTTGSGQQQQNKTFIAAITDTTVAASSPVAVDANGQLSDLGFGTATNVLTSNGAGVSPTWQAAGGGGSSTTFFAYANASIVNPTGDGTPYTVIFDSTLNNTGSAYATGTGLFTAPATGMYHFDTSIAFNAIQATSTTVVIQFNGSAVSVRVLQFQGATTALVEGLLCYSGGVTIPMTAGDTMSVLVNVGGVAKNVSLFGSGTPAGAATVFSGYRVS